MEQLDQQQLATKKMLLNTKCVLLNQYGTTTEYKAIDIGCSTWVLQKLDGKEWVDELHGDWRSPEALIEAFDRRHKITAQNLKGLPFRTIASKKRIMKALGLSYESI